MVAANSKGRGTYERHLSLLAKFWYYCYWYCHCQYITKKNLTNEVNHQPHCSGVYQNLGFLHHSHSFTATGLHAETNAGGTGAHHHCHKCRPEQPTRRQMGSGTPSQQKLLLHPHSCPYQVHLSS